MPCVVDRVIQQAILQVLTSIFDPGFSESSFGIRPKRSARGAIRQVKTFVKAGYRYAVDLDLEKFFDTVNHDVLMSWIARKVTDKVLLRLISRYLRAGVLIAGTIEATEWGTPQGSPLSPLLANILLDDLDKELEVRGHRLVRYIDDLGILVKSRPAGRRVMTKISHYLTQKLKLKVNREKSQVVKVKDLEYLGFTFRGIRIFASSQALQDFKLRTPVVKDKGVLPLRSITQQDNSLKVEQALIVLPKKQDTFRRQPRDSAIMGSCTIPTLSHPLKIAALFLLRSEVHLNADTHK